MKRFVRDLIFLIGGGLALVWFFPQWFGLNLTLGSRNSPTADILRDRTHLPNGFSINVYATGLPGARILRFTNAGELLVSIPSEGQVILLERDIDGNGISDGRKEILSGLNRPHGIDIYDHWLYVAETDAVGRIQFDGTTGRTTGEFERVITGLPGGGNHWSRTIKFGPDGLMYVSIGSSCNVCEEKDSRRAAILRFSPEGGREEIYATGLRNSVGFAWQPGTNELFAVDNGRDYLGDDFPPCELNRIERGKFYGWPYANGNKVPDPDFGRGHEQQVQNSEVPVHEFSAHTAPLGIAFLRKPQLLSAYQGAALITLHGSWNRSKKVGYSIVSIHFNSDGSITQRPFVSGFELNGDVIGRPVDVVEGLDGKIYFSDDYSGTIYRVAYRSANVQQGNET